MTDDITITIPGDLVAWLAGYLNGAVREDGEDLQRAQLAIKAGVDDLGMQTDIVDMCERSIAQARRMLSIINDGLHA